MIFTTGRVEKLSGEKKMLLTSIFSFPLGLCGKELTLYLIRQFWALPIQCDKCYVKNMDNWGYNNLIE